MNNSNPKIKDLKFFGLIFSAIFFGIFFFKFFNNFDINFSGNFLIFDKDFFGDLKKFFENNLNYFYFFYLGFIFLLTSFIFPRALLLFYTIWMKIGAVLGFINTKIIIGFLFFCIFYPIGFIGKIFGKNFLEKRIDKKRGSYFENSSSEKNNFDDQF